MTKGGWTIVALSGAVAILLAALMFMIGRATAPDGAESADGTVANQSAPAAAGNSAIANTSAETPAPRAPAPDSRAAADSAVGPAFTERFDDLGVTLRFVPTARFRRLVEYRTAPTSSAEDSSCSAPYSARERVTRVTFAWGFVIERFWTWNSAEGQQEYIVDETALPRAWHGSLHDLVRQGRTLTITKQRCGQGQVASLVSVRA
jgi:hypothetical protein